MVESSMGEAYDAPTGVAIAGTSCPRKNGRESLAEHRFIASKVTVVCGLAVSVAFFFVPKPAVAQSEWLTWGYDQQRTGWNQSETTLSRNNVSHLELKWRVQLPTVPQDVVLSTLTSPLVAIVNDRMGPKTRVFLVGSDNTVYAIDSVTGEVAWQRRFSNPLAPQQAASLSCSNTQNATPVISKDEGVIYVSTSDGKLRGLSLENGDERFPPIDFTTPFARNWSLNLIDGVIYSPTARGCGGAMSHFTALDLKDPARKVVEYYTSTGRGGGAWGRGGIVGGPKGVYAQTADGDYDPAAGKFAHSLMFLSFKDLRLLGTYTPENWQYMEEKDLDLGATNAPNVAWLCRIQTT
jgi:hypothetical protein